MAVSAPIQSVSNRAEGSTTLNFALTSVSVGSGLAMQVGLYNGGSAGSAVSVTDSGGNQWMLVPGATLVSGSYATHIFVCPKVTSGGSLTVTLNMASGGYANGTVHEIPVDNYLWPDKVAATSNSATTTCTTGNTAATVDAVELLLAVTHFLFPGSDPGYESRNPPSGWTAGVSDSGGGGSHEGVATCHKLTSSAGVQSCSWGPLANAVNTQNVLVAFRDQKIIYVGGATFGFAGGTTTANHSLTSLTGGLDTQPRDGDLVVVGYIVGTNTDRNPTLTIAGDNSGAYTGDVSRSETSGAYDPKLQTFYKRMGSTPDTQITRSGTGNVADGGSICVRVYRGVDASTPLDVSSTVASASGTGRPDPPAITPSTAGAWIVVFAGAACPTGTTVFTSSDLSDFQNANGADTQDGQLGAGHKHDWLSGSFDPAQFGGGSISGTNSWAAATMALRPASNASTAAGATITATASLIPGSATGEALAAGQTLTAAASLIAGSASAGTPATAAGDTLTATASLIPGAATGAATAAGQTITATASLVPGAATGAASAAGQTLTATASLVPGAATGAAAAAGATITATASLTGGAATGAAEAPGDTITATASLIPGGASGSSGATAPGATLTATASLLEGTATGAAAAAGQTLTATGSLIPGSATGAAAAPGTTLAATASLVPGIAAGAAAAAGATLTATASLIAGSANGGDAVAAGALLQANASIITGSAAGAAEAPGQILTATATFFPGNAAVSQVYPFMHLGLSLVRPVALPPAQDTLVGPRKPPGRERAKVLQ